MPEGISPTDDSIKNNGELTDKKESYLAKEYTPEEAERFCREWNGELLSQLPNEDGIYFPFLIRLTVINTLVDSPVILQGGLTHQDPQIAAHNLNYQYSYNQPLLILAYLNNPQLRSLISPNLQASVDSGRIEDDGNGELAKALIEAGASIERTVGNDVGALRELAALRSREDYIEWLKAHGLVASLMEDMPARENQTPEDVFYRMNQIVSEILPEAIHINERGIRYLRLGIRDQKVNSKLGEVLLTCSNYMQHGGADVLLRIQKEDQSEKVVDTFWGEDESPGKFHEKLIEFSINGQNTQIPHVKEVLNQIENELVPQIREYFDID